MLKKTIKYTDFNDVEQTDDFYFNLTKADLVRIELSAEGNSFKEQMDRVIKAENGGAIIKAFEDILKSAYGVRSPDGKRFIKNEQVWEEFFSSNAYSELFYQLVTDAGFASDFINGLTANLRGPDETTPVDTAPVSSETARARSEAALQGFKKPEPRKDHEASQIVDVPEPTPAPEDLSSLTREQLLERLSAS